jgi:cell pole-organizing protein PopZ
MSDQSPQEPTMEEILASIRRIISEDDAPAEEAAAAPDPEPGARRRGGRSPGRGRCPGADRSDRAARAGREHGRHRRLFAGARAGTRAAAAAPPAPAPEPIQGFSRDEVADNLVGDHAASLAATAFGSLSSALLMPKDGRTLEDVVRELLRPLLKEWLDQNLPRIVEAKVEEEVHRIARGRSV